MRWVWNRRNRLSSFRCLPRALFSPLPKWHCDKQPNSACRKKRNEILNSTKRRRQTKNTTHEIWKLSYSRKRYKITHKFYSANIYGFWVLLCFFVGVCQVWHREGAKGIVCFPFSSLNARQPPTSARTVPQLRVNVRGKIRFRFSRENPTKTIYFSSHEWIQWKGKTKKCFSPPLLESLEKDWNNWNYFRQGWEQETPVKPKLPVEFQQSELKSEALQ